MRLRPLSLAVVIGVTLAFGLGASSAHKVAPAPAPPAPTPTGYPGPGYGGRGCPGSPVRFLGVTTRHFGPAVDALAMSRACNEEFPVSRLCEWADIFRAIPPIALDTDVMVAPNYDSRPAPMCLNPDGGFNCSRATLMRPAACCGYILPPPPPPSPASIILTPSEASVTACTDTFEFTATALDTEGAPMAGITLVFFFPTVVGGTLDLFGYFNPVSGVSDENGQVTTTLSLSLSTCESNCVGPGKNCSTEIQATDAGRLIQSVAVNLVDQIP
ncbi:MAG TPA: hypothetical protein VJV75_12910 [Candidatus Polarisedimenticolia bacterium]|nr:hypothetical protein [Candidatus Polarisedimenticolia bacterium]